MALNQKQFIYPYTYEERKPMIFDRVLFIPSYYFSHQEFLMPEFSSHELFGNNNPVHVEFCSGNGEWIVEKALKNPHINFIASEIKFYRVRKIWVKIKQLNLNNLIVAFGDANDFIKDYLKDECVEAIYINFPDPWPKEKHAKNRLIKAPFTQEMKRILKKGELAQVVTDHEEYSMQVIEEMKSHFTPVYEEPHFIFETVEYGSSYFYRHFEEQGKKIRLMQFKKI
jgi:tRNA (guanine-N7-)-methyltransferase